MASISSLPSCARCGEPLGVYEPGIAVRHDGRVLDSSHMLRRWLAEATHYHPACAPDDAR